MLLPLMLSLLMLSRIRMDEDEDEDERMMRGPGWEDENDTMIG